MLLHMEGKCTMGELKSSLLSQSFVLNRPSLSSALLFQWPSTMKTNWRVNTKWVICQLYHDKDKLSINDIHYVIDLYHDKAKLSINDVHYIIDLYHDKDKLSINDIHYVIDLYHDKDKLSINDVHYVIYLYASVCFHSARSLKQQCVWQWGAVKNETLRQKRWFQFSHCVLSFHM
jgi:hypothetical protein